MTPFAHLGISEGVVNEEEHILTFLVKQIFSNGQSSEGNTEASALNRPASMDSLEAAESLSDPRAWMQSSLYMNCWHVVRGVLVARPWLVNLPKLKYHNSHILCSFRNGDNILQVTLDK